LATVAANCWDAKAPKEAVVGETETEITGGGCRVRVALPVTVVSETSVAVTVILVLADTLAGEV
jgi:hypothetical protein